MQRAQRYVRRRRVWPGASPEQVESTDGTSLPASALPAGNAPLQGRRRRSHFDERLDATRQLVGLTPEDEACIDDSRSPIAAHIGDVADDVYRGLLAQPETAAHFADARGVIDGGQIAMRRETFEEWLRSVVDNPLDAETAEYLASVGHAHVRPEHTEHRIKARYLVSTISRVQALFTVILSGSYSEPEKLGRYVTAWNKRLMIHLDLLLAVYGATESTAHWY